jgi:hypothetical protein
MKSAWVAILSAAAMALPASAQMVVSAKSGVVNYAEGQVLLNDQQVESSVTKYPDIKENSVLRTEAGRVEVLLTPGTILRLGENSSMKMITNRLVDTRLELLTGSAVVEQVETAKDNHVTVVVKNGAVSLAKAGVYRFDAEPGRAKVFHGEAVVELGGENTQVGSGRMVMLDGAKATVEKFDTQETDALDHWGRHRGELLAMANPSTAKSFVGGQGYGRGLFGMGFGMGYGGLGCNPYWGYNSWYAMYTYVPCTSYFMSPYGFGYWSPFQVNQVFRNPGYFGFNGGGVARTGGRPAMGSGSRGSAAFRSGSMRSGVGPAGRWGNGGGMSSRGGMPTSGGMPASVGSSGSGAGGMSPAMAGGGMGRGAAASSPGTAGNAGARSGGGGGRR